MGIINAIVDETVQQRERKKIIRECVALSKEHTHLVIQLPTSSGKGLLVAECIKASDSEKKWVVLVPEVAQITNYVQDLIKHGNKALLDTKIQEVMCYASVDKLTGRACNVHLNECHRVSEHRMDVLRTVEFDQIISDSATINPVIEARLTDIHPFHKYSKSLQEVIELGILPQPEVVCIGVEMTSDQKKEYNSLCQAIIQWEAIYNEQGQEWQRIKWMNNGSKRKRWLSSVKTDRAKELLEKLKNYKYIVYCGSVLQAKELGGKYAIHGKNKNNQQIIDDFNEGTTTRLFTCKMLEEGQNLAGIERGVIIQLDSTDRSSIQKIGRILRGEEPVIYIIFIKQSVDERYLSNTLTNIDKQHIKFTT